MNIVFVFADDWGKYASIYKNMEGKDSINSLINTPNIDRIAREGALFNNAFVPAPTCTPCRSSVLSGRYFWQTGMGAILQGAKWDENIPSYPLELEKNGWHIGHSYKVWAPGEEENAPYGAKRTAYNSRGTRFGQFSQEVSKLSKKIGKEKAMQVMFDEVKGNFTDFLDNRPEGAPFCYWCGPTNTHRTWERGSGKALWGLDPEKLKGKMPSFFPDVEDVREDFADYLGEAMAFDGAVGAIIKKLEDIGELDQTLFIVSGDHGVPGMPRSKCNLYNIGCEVALAVRWPKHISENRIINDFVNIMDLAPTFLEAADVVKPEGMSGRSLMPLLKSRVSGQIEQDRTFVVTGRERHVACAREGKLPYPQRAIHTKEYLYILNFEPDRWPMGTPKGIDTKENLLTYKQIEEDTFVTHADMDAGPTKAWMVCNRENETYKTQYDLCFDKRPKEELYDLKNDPFYTENVANDTSYQNIKEKLSKQLIDILVREEDPRVVEQPCRYELPPYTD
ncbi:sulfatase family protein [Vallitalea okinawensis]|uniref:sulfatase family protein n=1 Tax=Vallitalea okinawensis TaxID=2078660 RepID=UPI000CFC8615|nr:sulfatase [Vallitalea okinawensis]